MVSACVCEASVFSPAELEGSTSWGRPQYELAPAMFLTLSSGRLYNAMSVIVGGQLAAI
jgi:hypothetical protein